ncbi:hypothetical protein [Pseudofrankia asymbiotica]|uniref:hypothetical protein n=1 Tax=Pseudofrankia asymbiotica TaxID=1834516 RepID=UPI003B75D1EB
MVIGGALTQIDWRWTFFLPVAIAAGTLAAAVRHVPHDSPRTAATASTPRAPSR